MKNFRVLLMVLTIGIVMASCSEDDDEATSVSDSRYETTYLKYTETENGVTDSGEYKTKEELMAVDEYSVIEFKSDGKFIWNGEQDGTWVQSGSTVTITDDTDDVMTGTVDGNKFKISNNYTEEGYTYSMKMEFTKL